ncbi:netrin-1 isoform X2 [Octopus bimaculoides]|nr:netrin-1 isoform X2 [Octopus bimaculoides]|eukprot:XP_014780157.1 PREDICTED: netrin-1-like isoform X2 [Octopus bimaculoides]
MYTTAAAASAAMLPSLLPGLRYGRSDSCVTSHRKTMASRCVLRSLYVGLFLWVCYALPITLADRIMDDQPTAPNSCYDSLNKPKMCVAEFVNIAYGKEVVASSTCGTPPSRYCKSSVDKDGKVVRNCFTCDAEHPKRRHPASYLTDNNNSNNLTCWMSEPFVQYPKNVTLKLSLGKKYELTYILLQFCSAKPDSMAIYKSMDFGRSWIPFQYYSRNCIKMYGKKPGVVITKANQQEALCSNVHSNINTSGGTRVAFNTLENRPADFDNSPVLWDWVTATDIMFVFDKLSTFGDENSGEVGARESYYYSLSNLAVGGRCKCNGHASSCSKNSDGQTVCNCQHNTAGDSCERCKTFHFDIPWSRATEQNAKECVRCKCNQHARKCHFNREIYILSGYKSGGICVKCRHHTDGRKCNYCRPLYYRDHSKPIHHKKACKGCQCHPVGSVRMTCNQTTGQCTCKEGVTGLSCNRCAEGYEQTQSTIAPCVRVEPDADVQKPSQGRVSQKESGKRKNNNKTRRPDRLSRRKKKRKKKKKNKDRKKNGTRKSQKGRKKKRKNKGNKNKVIRGRDRKRKTFRKNRKTKYTAATFRL